MSMRERAASARNMQLARACSREQELLGIRKLPVALERRVAAEQKLGFRRRNE